MGADGSGMHSLHMSKAGTVTIRLLKTSPVNAQLMDMYNADTSSAAVFGRNTITVRDPVRGDSITCAFCGFRKPPDLAWAKDGNTHEWVFNSAEIDRILGQQLPPGDYLVIRTPYTFNVGGQTFQAAPMDPRTQLQVSRRVLPVLTGLLPAMASQFRKREEARKAAETAGEDAPPLTSILSMDMSEIVPGLQSAATALAGLPDDEFDYIQNACLRLVSMQRAGDTGWVRIWSEGAARLQFDDIQGHQILLIVVEVLKNEIGPFYVGLLSSLIDGDPLAAMRP
jgi:hypothetical protein